MQTLNQMPAGSFIGFQVRPSSKANCIHLSINFKNAVAPFTAAVPDIYITEAWMLFKWFKRMGRKGPQVKRKFTQRSSDWLEVCCVLFWRRGWKSSMF